MRFRFPWGCVSMPENKGGSVEEQRIEFNAGEEGL
jgi:hypothetical protein